jgi:hypothetical protein
VPVHSQNLDFHTTLCACPQSGPGFPHYIFVPVHSQDLDFHTTSLCLSTARTWISTLHVCACPQPGSGFLHYCGNPGPGCGQAQKCSVEIQLLAVDRHTNVVWKSRTWISTLNVCSCPQPGPGFPHYTFVPVHSQDLDFHTKCVCLYTARTWQKCSVEIQVLAVDRHKNVVWKSRSWLWTGTKM